jgi:TetR/AcrR family transcriptional regulator, repressor for neighboring sulfatase
MTTRSASAERRETPTGREEVAAAILDAATDLFAKRGPAATSIRDIAAASKVNHGLIFRHFGTKEQLVGAVLDHLGVTTTELLQNDPSAPGSGSEEETERALDRHMRVMARTLLDGYPAGKLQTRFPGAVQMLDRIRPSHGSGRDGDRSARLAVANAVALQLGWRLFAPFLRSAAGLEDLADDELRQAVTAEMGRLVEPH